MMLISCRAIPSVSAVSASPRPYTATHARPTAPATRAVPAQHVAVGVAPLRGVFDPALAHGLARVRRDREAGARVRERDEDRVVAGKRAEVGANALQLLALPRVR